MAHDRRQRTVVLREIPIKPLFVFQPLFFSKISEGSFETQLSECAAERGTNCMLISGVGVLRRTFACVFGLSTAMANSGVCEELTIDRSNLDVGLEQL